jgi:acylphosphatase
MPAVHLLIKGKVQGVFFRATAKDIADEMAISGWVRNTPDGDVEIIAAGSQQNIDRFVEWCKHGPEKAIVTNVSITQKEDQRFERFKILR